MHPETVQSTPTERKDLLYVPHLVAKQPNEEIVDQVCKCGFAAKITAEMLYGAHASH